MRASLTLLILLSILSCEQERWQTRSVPDFGLSLEIPCAPTPREAERLKEGTKLQMIHAGCRDVEALIVEIRLPPSERTPPEDEMMGSLMEIFARSSKATACERSPIRLGGHLGAELSCQLSESVAKRQLGLRHGGPVLVRLVTLAAERRALIWYAVGSEASTRRVIESAALE